MSDQLERLGIVITAEGVVELSDGTKLAGKAVEQLADNLGDLGKELLSNVSKAKAAADATKAVESASKSAAQAVAGQTTANNAAAAAHAKQAAGAHAGADALEHFSFQNKQAQRELIVLAHEMAQGRFTRFGGSIMVLAEQTGAASLLMSGLGIAIAAGALAIGGFAAAAVIGARESENLNNALHATGGFAGETAGQITASARRISESTGEGMGKAREAMQSLVASGRFTATSIESIGTAAVLMAKYTGQSEEDVLKHFAKMGDGVTEWAFKTNEQYHFLSLAQYKHIKALEDQGQAQDAMKVTGEALIAHLKDQRTELGYLETVLKKGKGWWREFWDAALDVGREQTLEEKLAAAQKRVMDLQTQTPLILGPNGERARAKTPDATSRGQADVNELAADEFWAQFNAKQRSAAANDSAEEIKKQHKNDKSHKAPDTSAQSYIDGLQRQLRAADGEARVYDTTLEHLITHSDKFTLAQGYAALALAESIDKWKDKKVVDEAEIKYLTEIAAKRDASNTAWQAEQETMRHDMADREFEISLIGKTTEQIARLTMARNVEKQAQAQRMKLAADVDSGAIGQDEFLSRLNAIDANAAAQLGQRNALLAEQFKPGWQKLLDGWTNTTQLQVDAYNAAMGQIVQGGEDMWVKLVTQGKFSARNLVSGVAAEMAKLFYRQNIAGPFAAMGNKILSSVFGNMFGGGGGFGTGAAYGNLDMGLFLHGGGVVGRESTFTRAVDPGVFRGAPRFHTGGIAGNEVPIIAQKGEGIFTKEQMSNLQPAGATHQITFAPTINIDARTDRAEVYDLVSRAVRAGQADLLDKLDRGMA